MKFVLIFFASLAIGVQFSLPRKSFAVAALIAVAGSMVNASLLSVGAHPQESAFLAAFAVALLAELLARKMKVPSPVLSIPGIIPLVPGSAAYRATTFLVDGKELSGAETAIGASLTAVGIASGLLLASSLARRVIKPLLARFAPAEHPLLSAGPDKETSAPDSQET